MKRIVLTFGMFSVSFLFISHGLHAQRIDRYGYGMEEDNYALNHSRELPGDFRRKKCGLGKRVGAKILNWDANSIRIPTTALYALQDT